MGGCQNFGWKKSKKWKKSGGGCNFGLIWENIPYLRRDFFRFCSAEKNTQEAGKVEARNGKGSDGDEENSARNEEKDTNGEGKDYLTDDNLQDKEKRQKFHPQTMITMKQLY